MNIENCTLLGLILISLASVPKGQAQTQVKVSTTLGEFTLELFDTAAPGTVENFLNYVTSGRFNESVVHRSVPNFVIQGGQYVIPAGTTQLGQIAIDGTIANEFNQSNLRGTVAMAKVAGDPDSATSQWFINVADNVSLDSQNGGFTVFGHVLAEGMEVVDAINQLPRVALAASLNELPVVNFSGSVARENLVLVDMELVAAERSPASNRFDETTGQLVLKIDAGDSGFVQVAFSVESQSPQVIVRALAESVTVLDESEEDFATFDESTGQLLIPGLEIGGQIVYRNLLFLLTDAVNLLFSLESLEEARAEGVRKRKTKTIRKALKRSFSGFQSAEFWSCQQAVQSFVASLFLWQTLNNLSQGGRETRLSRLQLGETFQKYSDSKGDGSCFRQSS